MAWGTLFTAMVYSKIMGAPSLRLRQLRKLAAVTAFGVIRNDRWTSWRADRSGRDRAWISAQFFRRQARAFPATSGPVRACNRARDGRDRTKRLSAATNEGEPS